MLGPKVGIYGCAGGHSVVEEHFMSNLEGEWFDLVIEKPATHISNTVGRRINKHRKACDRQRKFVSTSYQRLSKNIMKLYAGTKYPTQLGTTNANQ